MIDYDRFGSQGSQRDSQLVPSVLHGSFAAFPAQALGACPQPGRLSTCQKGRVQGAMVEAKGGSWTKPYVETRRTTINIYKRTKIFEQF